MSGPSFGRVVDAFRAAGLDIDVTGADRAMAQAPGHSGKSGPSGFEVSLRYVNGKTTIKAFNGEDEAEVLAAVGLTFADLYDDPKTVRTYTYPGGAVVHKSWNAKGRKTIKQSNARGDNTLLRTQFDPTRPVYVLEGESDYETAVGLGVQATTARGGAGNVKHADLSPLSGLDVRVVLDDDEPGRQRGLDIFRTIGSRAAEFTLLLPKVGKDFTDHIAAGYEIGDLVKVPVAELSHLDTPDVPVAAAPRRVVLSAFADERDDVPVWGWEYEGKGRIPIGAVTLFAGRPGAGKSTAGRWIAASASTGTLAGCWMGKPINVAYLSTAEESAKYVVKPGLRAAGADLTRVLRPTVQFEGEEVRFLSSRDMGELTNLLTERGVKLVVVDPLMATIGSTTDINRNNEVRGLIEPWARLAEHIDGAVIGIAHLNKSGNGDVVAGINGSSAFGEVARAVFGFAKDPESDDSDRIMSQEKNSIGEEDLAITYRIESQTVTTDSGKTADVGRFVIVGNSDRSVGEVLRTANAVGRDESAPRSQEVDDWLLDLLASGPVESNDIFKSAKGAGYSTDQVRRAKNRINKSGTMIEVTKTDGPWLWKIAGFVPTPTEPPSSPPCISSQVKDVFEDGNQDSAPSSRWQLEIASDLEGSKMAPPTGVGDQTCSAHGTILGQATGKCIDCVLESAATDGIAS